MRLALLVFIFLLLPVHLFYGQEIPAKDLGNNRVTTSALAFSPDGRYLLAGAYLKKYDINTGMVVWRAREKDTENSLDESILITVNRDRKLILTTKSKRIEIWDLNSQPLSPRKLLNDSRLTETAACFSKGGDSVIYMRNNGEIVFIKIPSYTETPGIKIMNDPPMSLTLSSDGKKIIVGTKTGNVHVFDMRLKLLLSVPLGDREIRYIEASPDGNYLAASTTDGKVWLGQFPSLSMNDIGNHPKGPTPISFHPSGKFLATGGADSKVHFWKIPECEVIKTIVAHKRAVTSLCFSPSGDLLATGSENVPLGAEHDTKVWTSPGEILAYAQPENRPKNEQVVQTQALEAQKMSSAGKRLALVIGNSNYNSSPLANPVNDARAMKEVLLNYGFDVMEYENLNQAEMKRAMDDFGDKLKGYAVGLFFYAGHGIQSKGYNYLIPVDAELKSEQDVEYDCTPADRILAKMEAAGSEVNIIILDACRNNPFERSWTRSTEGNGLAGMDAPNGSLIALATSPGRTASDGSGNNGLYTSAILESISQPGLNIMQIFQNVRRICLEKSGGKQRPWESTSLVGDFYF